MLDFGCLLQELSRLDAELPVMLEHLPDPNDYDLAAAFVRQVARQEAIALQPGDGRK